MATDSLPLVTIAIPTRNRAGSFLPAALAAARAQDYPRLEIIVADNASTDETAAFMQTVRDERVRYLRHQTNIGAQRNYNYCLMRARGDYFLLLHDDDAIDDDFVSACLAAADHRVIEGVIRTGVRVIDQRGQIVRESKNLTSGSLAGYYQAWFSGKTSWYLVNTLFHRERLRQEGGFHSPHHLSEDGFAIARLARFGRVDLPEIKASFRVHPGENTMAQPTEAALWGREYLALLESMCAFVSPEEAMPTRRMGRRFFARLAYKRAALARTPLARLAACYEVLRLFGYRHWPIRPWTAARRFGRSVLRAGRRSRMELRRDGEAPASAQS
jgi:hypothetical protein